MPTRYTLSQAAHKLGISRRALYDWLQAADLEPGASTDGRVKTLTEAQITRLAARHGRQVQGVDVEALAAEVATLREHVQALEELQARLEALEQQIGHLSGALAEGLPASPQAPSAAIPAPGTTSASAWRPPAPVRLLVARWVAEGHGAALSVARSWADLPLEPVEALRFAASKLPARLHQCAEPGCPCHTLLPPAQG